MNWRQQRRHDLEQRMSHIVTLLGQLEQRLIYEEDPQSIGRLRFQITELRAQQSDCQSDLNSLEQDQEKQRRLALKMADLTFEDLNFVITAFLRQKVTVIEDQNTTLPTKPEEKMSKNGLTFGIKLLLDTGLAKTNEVRHLIENNAKINFPDVPERLKAALNSEYVRLMEEGVSGDDLFMRLHDFSSCHNPDFRWRLAGLAVLCYFFEACDVFEP